MLRDELRTFALDRGWDQFHTPKNLASALSVEAAELLEPFQWLKTGELSELDAYSGPKQPPIPVNPGHPFRLIPATLTPQTWCYGRSIMSRS
jgi:hypothetical protein